MFKVKIITPTTHESGDCKVIYFVTMCICGMSLCGYAHVSACACGDQKGAADPLYLKL